MFQLYTVSLKGKGRRYKNILVIASSFDRAAEAAQTKAMEYTVEAVALRGKFIDTRSNLEVK